MRQFVPWALSLAVLAIASSVCSTTQHLQEAGGPLSGLSGRTAKPAATPAQLASYQPKAVQPPPGGYQAELASTSRSAASKRFQLPKCFSSG